MEEFFIGGIETSIPLHLEFAKKRKQAQPNHFAQVVRLVKFWARRMKQERDGFRFKSFMVELILARLSDCGMDFSDYPEVAGDDWTEEEANGVILRLLRPRSPRLRIP